MSRDPRIDAVLGFRFGEPAERALGHARPAWFRKDPGFDGAIRERFGALVDEALGRVATPEERAFLEEPGSRFRVFSRIAR